MYCGLVGTGGVQFGCLAREACAAEGGQCKGNETSAYRRPGPSTQAPAHGLGQGAAGAVQQAHLVGGRPEEVTVVFATEGFAPSAVQVRAATGLGGARNLTGSGGSYSVMIMPTGMDGVHEHGVTPGHDMAYCSPYMYKSPECYYTSPVIHRVTLRGLTPGEAYEYRPSGSDRWRRFRAWPAVGQPIAFGVLADVGQTRDSVATIGHLNRTFLAGGVDAGLLVGDLSYADGYAPAWDSWGRLTESLFERLPTAFAVGNHEVANGMENFAHYTPRYGWPEPQQSGSSVWYSFEAGLAHVVVLCSYCDYSQSSLQRAWLAADLGRVDRQRTPWLIVLMHVPFYSSNAHHGSSESDAMKASMEELLYTYKADIILSGHVHAYERTGPVFRNEQVCDAPVQLVVGDGGNKEGPACPWNLTAPAWSRRREFSFGHGVLSLRNATHARWAWHRNQDSDDVEADAVWLQTASSRCSVALDLLI